MSIKQFVDAVVDNESIIKTTTFKPSVDTLLGDVVTPDGANGNFFDVYLNRPMTRITMPDNFRNGETYRFQIRQDGTGGKFLRWGDYDTFTDLNVSVNTGMGGTTLIIYVNSGTFDWNVLRAGAGRKSFINLGGFANNVNNINGLKLVSFDESAGSITVTAPNWDIIDEDNATGIMISVENAFYFIDEKGDDWISQFPYGVTMFEVFTTTSGESALLVKKGVYSNSLYQKAKIRFEEQLTDDFINGSDDGLLNWRESNANGNTATSSADVDENHVGILIQRLSANATAKGRTSTTMGSDGFVVSNMRAGISGIVKPNGNAFTTADVNYYFGWIDGVQFQISNNGAMFKIVADGTGKGRVHCITQNGGIDTDYDTGIDLTEDNWYSLHIGVPSNGGDIMFIIDNYLVHTADRSTMDDTQKVTCGFGQYYDYNGTTLPNNKEWFIDAFSIKYRMNHDRI